MKARSLALLRQLRRLSTLAHSRDVANAVDRLREAESKLALATERVSSMERAVDQELAEESNRVDAGLSRAGDLASAERFRSAATRRLAEEKEAKRGAERDVAGASAAAQTARLTVERAAAAERAVTDSLARTLGDARAAAERRTEDEANEDQRARAARDAASR